MANSNVRSSAYRAAGAWNSWGKVKTGSNHLVMDAPKPSHIIEHIKDVQDSNDIYCLQKAELRASLAEGYDESLVTVIEEGNRSPLVREKRKKVLTARRKKVTIAPTKKLNRKERRALKKS